VKTTLLSIIVSTILLGTPVVAFSQDFPVDLQSLRKEKDSWLNPESMEGYTGAVYSVEEGEIVFKGHLKEGHFHGRYEDYRSKPDSFGSKGYERGTYEEGSRAGSFEVYSSNGKLLEKGIYLNGVRDGPYSAYHDNMRIWIKTAYILGRWNGPYESFDRDGALVSKGHYRADSQCGVWVQRGKTIGYPPCK
jgi:antitoxin component YwqK of YwqJK toxin-antitoxin module